jgi:hypothetical protein
MAEGAGSAKQAVVCSVEDARNYFILQASTTPTRVDEDESFKTVVEEVK